MQEFYFDNFPFRDEREPDYFSDVNPDAPRSGGVGAADAPEKERREPKKTKTPKAPERVGGRSKRGRTLLEKLSGKPRRSLNQCYHTSDKTLNDLFEPSEPGAVSPEQKKDRFFLYRILPFIHRKEDIGSWVYRHKVSVSITMGVYIISLIVFFSMRIHLTAPEMASALLIEIQPEQPPVVEEKPEVKPEEEPEEDIPTDVKNRISDANAKTDAGKRTDRGQRESDLLKEMQDMQSKLDAAKANYQKGLREEEAMIREAQRKKDQKQGKNEDTPNTVKQKGNVVVEYDLKNRTAVSLLVAAYQCEEAGRVTVNITVNNSGDVVEAAVARSSSKNTCLSDMALAAARVAKFNASADAPARQKGTITYLFIAQ